MKLHNVSFTSEIIVEDGVEITPEAILKQLIKAAKNGRWIHVALPRIVHTRTEEPYTLEN